MSETKEAKRVVVLTPQRFMQAEYERNVFVANAAEGTTVEDVLKQEYWSHIGEKLNHYDRIEVRVDTGEWMLDLLVLEADRRWARVKLLHKYVLEKSIETTDAAEHEVAFKGPQLKWCVIRKSDSEVLFRGMSKADAIAQMERHEVAVA